MVKPLFYGRLGNVCWQLATAVAYAAKFGVDLTVPNSTNDAFWNPLYFQHLVNPAWDSRKPQVRVNEEAFHFNPLPFKEDWRGKNIILNGYFQSWKYIEGFRDEILNAFALPYTYEGDICSIHARYGDYLTIEENGKMKHIVMNEDYLLRAMDIIKSETGIIRFKVFSDDLPLFKQRHGHLYDFEYSSGKSEMEDMTGIANCAAHINSSSTFSWWGAWLSRHPHVTVTPEKWFGDNWGGADTKDVIPHHWIKI